MIRMRNELEKAFRRDGLAIIIARDAVFMVIGIGASEVTVFPFTKYGGYESVIDVEDISTILDLGGRLKGVFSAEWINFLTHYPSHTTLITKMCLRYGDPALCRSLPKENSLAT